MRGALKTVAAVSALILLPAVIYSIYSLKGVCIYMASMLAVVLGVIAYNTISKKSRQYLPESHVNADNICDGAVERLSRAVKYKTISYMDKSEMDLDEFKGFMDFIRECFPTIHNKLTREVINDYSVVFKWKGTDSGTAPLLLLAHYDVVPVEEEEEKWSCPPFSGEIIDGCVWGRGTMDDKSSLMSILEAVEQLLKTGYIPDRDIYLAFGHDEETGGHEGAKKAAQYFKENGIRFDFAVDEGLLITKGIMPEVKSPIAFIGLAEKGYVSIELTARGQGGHSSMPPGNSAVYILAKALNILERRKFRSSLNSVVRNLFDYLYHEMSPMKRVVFANMWLTQFLVKKVLSSKNTTNAMIRTTIAPTILSSGSKENVLPQEAKAVINLRILPGESIESCIGHIKSVLRKFPVDVRKLDEVEFEPSGISDINSNGFSIIQKSIGQVFTGTIAAPSMALAGSDSRHYAHLCRNIYRFVPLIIEGEDSKRIHGVNERVSIDNYKKMIGFYTQLIKNS